MSCLKEKAMVGRIGGTLIGALIAGPSDWATPALGGAIGFGSGFVHGLFTCPPNNDPNPYHRGHLHRAIGHHLATILITLTIRGVVTPMALILH